MVDTYCVPLTTLVDAFHLEVAYAADDYDAIRLTVADVARPGLQLAGYFDHFEPMRLQVVGNVEVSYLNKLNQGERTVIYDRLFSYKFPALIITRNIPPDPVCMKMAQKHNVTVLRSPEVTSDLVSTIVSYLKAELAPRITRHGVLMEVYGEGVLLIGESGIGKSETAVELVKRGHRLIADDAVEIKRISERTLIGSAPALIHNYIELRGIGIINVAKLFGVGAVKTENQIDMVVNIVPWNTQKVYDRLGLEDQHMELLGVKVPMNTIPVTPGRNLAVILEVAAINNRQRKMGYNAALEFTEQINRHFDQNIGTNF
jgi:HPr kinase/phosphorylase